MAIECSVVVPVFNEEAVIAEFNRRLGDVLAKTGMRYEILYVNDGSTDRSMELLREFGSRNQAIRVISFSRNFGHQIAITAGLDMARGDAVVVIDADLQDPPEAILDLLAKWREGYQVVYAVRESREGEGLLKRWTARMFYRLLRRLTQVDIPLDVGDFRLLDRKVVEVLRKIRERHRFVRGLVSWVGYRQAGIPFRRQARYAGETKYPLRRMLKFAVDGMTSFSNVPLQIASYLGAVISVLSFLYICVVIVWKLFFSGYITGIASTLVMVLFLGGIQLLFLGVIGEYLGRIYDEVKGRPLYVIGELVNVSEQDRPRDR